MLWDVRWRKWWNDRGRVLKRKGEKGWGGTGGEIWEERRGSGVASSSIDAQDPLWRRWQWERWLGWGEIVNCQNCAQELLHDSSRVKFPRRNTARFHHGWVVVCYVLGSWWGIGYGDCTVWWRMQIKQVGGELCHMLAALPTVFEAQRILPYGESPQHFGCFSDVPPPCVRLDVAGVLHQPFDCSGMSDWLSFKTNPSSSSLEFCISLFHLQYSCLPGPNNMVSRSVHVEFVANERFGVQRKGGVKERRYVWYQH